MSLADRIMAKMPFSAMRRQAVQRLASSRDDSAVPILVQALTDGCTEVRRAGAEALAKLGWQPADGRDKAYFAIAKDEFDKAAELGLDAVEPLSIALNKWRQVEAVEALGRIGGQSAVEVLIRALRSPGLDKSARMAAAGALGVTRDQDAVEPLAQVLAHGVSVGWDLCTVAAEALGMIGGEKAERTLRGARAVHGATLALLESSAASLQKCVPADSPLRALLAAIDQALDRIE